MNKKVGLGVAGVVVLLILLIRFEPTRVVWGTLTGEAFYEGRPSSHWATQLAGGPTEHSEAVRSLQGGGTAGVDVLIELLGSERGGQASVVSRTAVEILSELGPEANKAGDALIAALGESDLHLPSIAARALPKVDTPAEKAIPALTPLLQSKHSIAASRAISEYHGQAKSVIPELIAVLRDESLETEVRWNAARTLGKVGPDGLEALPTLIEFTTNSEDTIREHAAEAIGDIGPTAVEGIPALIECLDDPYTRVRRDAVRSLGYMGEAARETVPQVKKLLDDSEELVRDAAKNALKAIAPEELPQDDDKPAKTPKAGP
ncbi:MAG: hypothetical protein CMJ48_12895 [Planctomycetaceae bacterium]|nr:hypothetical protein [Planctomycetaceae bacterium]